MHIAHRDFKVFRNPLRGFGIRRVIAVYLITFLLIFSIFAAIYYHISTRQFSKATINSHTALLGQAESQFDSQMNQINREALSFEQQPKMVDYIYGNYASDFDRRMGAADLLSRINTLVCNYQDIDSIYLYSRIRNSVLTESGYSSLGGAEDTCWISAYNALDRDTEWLPTRQAYFTTNSGVNSKNLITLVRLFPAYCSAYTKTGAIIVNLDEASLYHEFDKIEKSDNGSLFIVGRDGTILSARNKSSLHTNIAKYPCMKKILRASDSSGMIEGTINWIPCDIFYQVSPLTSWIYIYTIPKVEANAPLSILRNLILLASLSFISLGALLVVFISRLTYRPFRHFMRTVAAQIQDSGNNILSEDGDPENLGSLEEGIQSLVSRHAAIQKQMSDSLPAIRWKLVNDLLTGSIETTAELDAKLQILGASLPTAAFTVMVAAIDTPAFSEPLEEKSAEICTVAACRIVEELIEQGYSGISGELMKNRISVILSFMSPEDSKCQMEALNFATMIQSEIQERTGLTVSIGIGNPVHSVTDIPRSYYEASETLKYKIITGANALITTDDIRTHEEKEYYKVFGMVDSLTETIKAGSIAGMESRLSEIQKTAVSLNMPPVILRELSINMILDALKKAKETGVKMDAVIQENHLNIYATLNQLETIQDMREYIKKVMTLMIREIVKKRTCRANVQMIAEIRQFIDLNFSNCDLALSLVADRFGLSVPYLSKLFKENMEMNFTDYLVEKRMAAAMELLENTRFKVNEIAGKVGYQNIHSFIRIFKSHTGRTPSEFRSEKCRPSPVL